MSNDRKSLLSVNKQQTTLLNIKQNTNKKRGNSDFISISRIKLCKCDIMQSSIKEIKEIDNYKHWWCTEYADDIYENLRFKEQNRFTYLFQSPQKQYRNNLVSLIMLIAENEELSTSTVHLSIYLLDVFMDSHKIFVERLKLVALVCLLLACKLEEKETKVPKVVELNKIINQQYLLNDYLSLELMILTFMDWSLVIPTAANFFEYFIAAFARDFDYSTLLFNNEGNKIQNKSTIELHMDVVNLCFEFLTLTLQENEMITFLPSKIAAACIVASSQTLGIYDPLWTKQLEKITKYKFTDIEIIVEKVLMLRKKFQNKNEHTDSGYLSELDT